MKSTGIIRKLDELGRIVLPVELRKNLDIKEKDPMEISTNNDCIILRKKIDSCVFCSSSTNLNIFKSKYICNKCLKKLKEELKWMISY